MDHTPDQIRKAAKIFVESNSVLMSLYDIPVMFNLMMTLQELRAFSRSEEDYYKKVLVRLDSEFYAHKDTWYDVAKYNSESKKRGLTDLDMEKLSRLVQHMVMKSIYEYLGISYSKMVALTK